MVSLGGKTFYSRCICRAGFTTVGGGAPPPNFGFSGPPPPSPPPHFPKKWAS